MGDIDITLDKTKPSFQFSEIIKYKMIKYYSDYYKNQLGLKDYELRIQNRLREEEIENKKLERLSRLLNFEFGSGQRHLIVGTGTGGLAVELHKRGCTVFGVEPNVQANEIVKLKARDKGIPENNFHCCKAEFLPFASSYFDFVHCFTVIEHVDDVEKTIDEMIRVLKLGGRIYVNTPDYRFPYEGHYKIPFPTFLPKFVGYLFLLLKRRPFRYLKHINYVTEENINRILYSKDVIWHRIYASLPDEWFESRKMAIKIYRTFTLKLNIPKNQEIVIIKNWSDSIE